MKTDNEEKATTPAVSSEVADELTKANDEGKMEEDIPEEEKVVVPAAEEKAGVVVSKEEDVPAEDTVMAPAEEEKAAVETKEDTASSRAEASEGEKGDVAAETAAAPSEERSSLSFLDKSSHRVLVQGVYKYDDVKGVRKTVTAWLKAINDQQQGNKEEGEEGAGPAPPPPPMEFIKVKKPPKDTWMVVTLKDEAMVEPFIDYINNCNDGVGITNKKGRKLFAKRPVDVSDQKRQADGDPRDGSDSNPKRRRLSPEAIEAARRPVSDDEVRDATTPLWRLSQEDQINSKMKDLINKGALKIVKGIKSRFRSLDREKGRKEKVKIYEWLQPKTRVIDIQDMIPVPSPLRNKCEFTFGYRYLFTEEEEAKEEAKDGKSSSSAGEEQQSDSANTPKAIVRPKIPAVGFMATGWAGGVSRPHVCQNIPSEACAVVDVVERFLADSPLPPYDTKTHTGMWKLLTVRSSRRTKECMVIIQHSPVSGGAGEKEGTTPNYSDSFETEKERLLSMLTGAELPVPDQDPLKVTSIFFQEYEGLSTPAPDHPVQHAFGKTSLVERVGNCTFQISPGAFFQVNTIGAELLYQRVVDKVREASKDPQNTLLFDVCCGTGSIGLFCLKEGVVGHVVGVDISAPAIADAEKNAELNGFGASEEGSNGSKVRFVAARAEDVLAREIGQACETDLNFVAVVDPAREGLHADVLRTLRNNTRIRRIVYVSCNPTGSLINDATILCTPPTKRYFGPAFRIESACPVDMFPLTNHYELVMTFDRIDPE